ncbi:MAG: DNA repair protein RecN [Anaerolineales bacterium]
MLTELRIRDFAIIDELQLDLARTLVIFTGETGAGKSIILDAVDVLMGGRADPQMVRSGAAQALVEGTFHIPEANRQQIHAILEREELLDDPAELTIAREIRANSRSVARVNGRVVALSLLRELGENLIDLHGQSEHLSLLRPREHLGLLDRYAEIQPALAAYRSVYDSLQKVRRDLKTLRQLEQDASRRREILTYQLEEIQAARLKPGEEEDLRTERDRLANAEGLAAAASEALQALDEGNPEAPAVTDLLGHVVHALNALHRLDPTQSALSEQAQTVFEAANDLSRELRTYLENIEFNPRRLDQTEERLALIHSLKRKYGENIPAILAYAEKTRIELENIASAAERMAELTAQETTLLKQLAQHGLTLSQQRQRAAQTLATAIQTELRDLRMDGAQFQVDFQRRPDPNGIPLEDGTRCAFDANGFEQVEFLIAPNLGEGFKPLAKIASGGETSRLMLALKNVLAHADSIPTLIFDEIDQGIGGRVGMVVGKKLWNLTGQHQVLCITHLPQLAAFADQHLHVQKLVQNGRTTTQVQAMYGETRLRELAQMFGELSEGTLRSADEILNIAQTIKTPR